MSRRHIWRVYNLQPHQQRCVEKISNPKPKIIFTSIFTFVVITTYNHRCVYKISNPHLQPNPQFLAKPSANFLIFNHPPRLRGIFDETFWREDIVVPFVTTYAIPLRSAYIDLYIINHYCISSTKLQHLLKPAVITAHTHTSIKKHLGDALFPSYFVTPHSSLKWMNNAALEEATNRGVLVNTSQVGNF